MFDNDFTIGIIISTYNNPNYLKKTLWGYCYQTRLPNEIIIADDGSTQETAKMLEEFANKLNIKHIWHEDKGFRKTTILNKALLASTADYLIFTDQDCVPREDFVETHAYFAAKGRFLSGGYFKIPMEPSQKLDRANIENREIFDLKWLLKNGVKRNFKCTKLIRNKYWSSFMNFITPANASWNGCNSSTWRDDLLDVCGFDQRMAYGGEDRELGERLVNKGLKGKQIRYSAIAIHLDHSRPYVNQEAWDINNAIRRETRKNHIVKTSHGINQKEQNDTDN